jgi:NADH:ubiquinone oxidoreductase subunit 2 (subunit N)
MNIENYLIIYTITVAIIMPFLMSRIKTYIRKKQTSIIILCLIIVGGIPPIMGFLPKVMVSMSIIEKEIFIILTLILITSTLDILVYSRIRFISAIRAKTSMF